MKTKEMSFSETIEYLKRESQFNAVLKQKIGPERDDLNELINYMGGEIQKVINGEDTDEKDSNTQKIEYICRRFLVTYLTGVFEEEEINFFYHFSTLVFNYAQALSLDEKEITKTVNALLTALNMHKSCVNAVSSIKMLTDIIEKYLRFDPPAYQISRAYLESLYNDFEGSEV